jgi:hypothetical protein
MFSREALTDEPMEVAPSQFLAPVSKISSSCPFKVRMLEGLALKGGGGGSDMLSGGGFIKGILRGVRCTKSLRVYSFYIDGPPPGPLLYCTQEQYSSLMNPPWESSREYSRDARKKV